MRERITHVAEMDEAARTSPSTTIFGNDGDAVAYLIGEFRLPPHMPLRRRRSRWNRYHLYGALLGVLEVAVLLYSLFGGRS